MTAEDIQAVIGALLFMGAGLIGIRASWRLRKRYLRARPLIDERNRPLLFMVVVACWIITAAALWIGSLSIVRLMTSTTFPWTPPITLTIATIVIFLPAMFEYSIEVVAPSDDPSLVYKVMKRLRPERPAPPTIVDSSRPSTESKPDKEGEELGTP